jgi:hypothetical protein
MARAARAGARRPRANRGRRHTPRGAKVTRRRPRAAAMAKRKPASTRGPRRSRRRSAKSARPARSARTRSAARPKRAKARPARDRARLGTKRQPALSRPSRRTAGDANFTARAPTDTPRPLDFEAGDDRSGRAGDRKSLRQQRDEFPRSRVREAGMTAGETTHPHRNTADDAAPDTLLDDEGGQNPADQRGPVAADTALSVVDESAIGAGGGTDEAEDATRNPISEAELRRLKRRVARSGGSLANVEPAESQAGSPGRERNRQGRQAEQREGAEPRAERASQRGDTP